VSGAICDGGSAFLARRYMVCPTEGVRRRFVTRSQAWYGTDWHCLGCGDEWSSEEGRYPRPFERGWRARAIRRARAMWAQVDYAAGGRRAAQDAWLRAVMT
jgi:hypothetical protein